MPEFINRIFSSPDLVPEEYRSIFFHFYSEIAWFGILNGTTLSFLVVYATRLGATTQQVGVITAAPGLINLIFTLPVGSWLNHRALGRSVFWTTVTQRIFYLLMIPLPLLFLPKTQVLAIILATFLMAIPGTAAVVGFNAFFGEVVPLEWRGHVVGIRNAALSVTTTVFTLVAGGILSHVPFPLGYQIVFTMGAIGAGMSSLHLYLLSRIAKSRRKTGVLELQPSTQNGHRLSFEIRALLQQGMRRLRLDAMRGRFARVMVLVFGWHLFQYSVIPLITPFAVNVLGVSDQTIGLAGALFNTLTFTGSIILGRFTIRFGNKVLTGVGVAALGLFPIIMSTGPVGYLIANVIAGFAWAFAGGALYNYVLENSPSSDLPTHLAWYNLIFNAGVLLGSIIGPTVASLMGYQPALILFGICRFLAGLAILIFG